MSDLPPPARAYRGSAMLHGFLALAILVIAALTGGGLARALLVALAYFVVATGWNVVRWRARLREAEAERARHAEPE